MKSYSGLIYTSIVYTLEQFYHIYISIFQEIFGDFLQLKMKSDYLWYIYTKEAKKAEAAKMAKK